MLRETKILLIEDDAERRRDLTVILNFLGEEHLAASSSEWRTVVAQLESSREVFCVLLGTCQCKHGVIEVLKQLAAWDEYLPVIWCRQIVPRICLRVCWLPLKSRPAITACWMRCIARRFIVKCTTRPASVADSAS